MNREELNRLSGDVVDVAMEVHRTFGPGLLEKVYELALEQELVLRGVAVERQLGVFVSYKGVLIDEEAYRIDLLVAGAILVELKTVASLLPVHEAQLVTYLKLMQKNLGLLINFNVPLLKDGIKRKVHNLPEI